MRPTVDPPCQVTAGVGELPEEVLTAKQGERTKAVEQREGEE